MSACRRFCADTTNPNTASKILHFAACYIARRIIAQSRRSGKSRNMFITAAQRYRGKCTTPRLTEPEMAEKLGVILKQIHIPDYVLAGLQKSLANPSGASPRTLSPSQRNALQPRVVPAMRRRIDQAYQDKLDGKIPEEFWERKMTRVDQRGAQHPRCSCLPGTTDQQAPADGAEDFRTREQSLFSLPYAQSRGTG